MSSEQERIISQKDIINRVYDFENLPEWGHWASGYHQDEKCEVIIDFIFGFFQSQLKSQSHGWSGPVPTHQLLVFKAVATLATVETQWKVPVLRPIANMLKSSSYSFLYSSTSEKPILIDYWKLLRITLKTDNFYIIANLLIIWATTNVSVVQKVGCMCLTAHVIWYQGRGYYYCIIKYASLLDNWLT